MFTKAGNYETVVRVDTGNAVSETNEKNNLAIKALTVLPPGVNLVIDSFTVVPVEPDPTESVVEGRLAGATIVVQNTGNAPAGPFQVSWTPYVFGKPLTKSVVGSLPGATATVQMEYTYPFAGTVKTTADVDSANQVAETDEFDNTATDESGAAAVAEPAGLSGGRDR